jgi:hypothetical protein
VALHAALRYPNDLRAALSSVIRCGGDTDTTAAIVGGVVGARVGKAGIPHVWLSGLCEWPRSVAWIERVGERLALAIERGAPLPLPTLPVPALAARNALFMSVVLYHGLRRLLPPY